MTAYMCLLCLVLATTLQTGRALKRTGLVDDSSTLADVGSILQDTSVELAPDMGKIGRAWMCGLQCGAVGACQFSRADASSDVLQGIARLPAPKSIYLQDLLDPS